jgi:hypothetical protein
MSDTYPEDEEMKGGMKRARKTKSTKKGTITEVVDKKTGEKRKELCNDGIKRNVCKISGEKNKLFVKVSGKYVPLCDVKTKSKK